MPSLARAGLMLAEDDAQVPARAVARFASPRDFIAIMPLQFLDLKACSLALPAGARRR